MKKTAVFILVAGLALITLQNCAPEFKHRVIPREQPFWLGLHVLIENKPAAEALLSELPALADAGINLLIFEIDYNYEYVSHPELRGDDPISRVTIKKVVKFCRDHKIRLIPEFQSLGHQSWAEKTFPLLIKHIEFDETPGQFPGNKDIYCRSWCPLHPDVNPIIFALFDDLLEVFEADALHVGMDEVFLIGSEFCSRCRGKDPAELFAKAVNDYYQHLVKKRGVEMLMWGDRLLDGDLTGYGEWEASLNGTHPAIDLIPKNIIICDWHYERMKSYPSIPFFLNKGFRILPTSFRDVKQTKKLIDYSLAFPSERMLGHLCTIWAAPEKGKTSRWPPLLSAVKKLQKLDLLMKPNPEETK